MTIFQRWKQTALHNKALVITGAIFAVGTVLSTGVVVVQVCIMRANNRATSEQTTKLIQAANTQAGAATSFAESAQSINQEMKGAVYEFTNASKAQLQATTRQLTDFENTQAANLTIEELGASDWEHSNLVTYKLVNRGSSLASSIGYREGEDTEVVPPRGSGLSVVIMG